jgi:uncharacterized protein with FMN-binding domain
VAAIYAVGYTATRPARPSHAQARPAAQTGPPAASSGAKSAPGGTDIHPGSAGYRDGRFTGTGSSPYGEISVEVRVRGGRIASVEVTGATTFFPADDVSPLVPEVISRQSAQVDVVSGATGSSQAFQGAVQRALTKATR